MLKRKHHYKIYRYKDMYLLSCEVHQSSRCAPPEMEIPPPPAAAWEAAVARRSGDFADIRPDATLDAQQAGYSVYRPCLPC